MKSQWYMREIDKAKRYPATFVGEVIMLLVLLIQFLEHG